MVAPVWDTGLFMQIIALIKKEIIFNVVCMLWYRGKNYAVDSRWELGSLSLAYVIGKVDWSVEGRETGTMSKFFHFHRLSK